MVGFVIAGKANPARIPQPARSAGMGRGQTTGGVLTMVESAVRGAGKPMLQANQIGIVLIDIDKVRAGRGGIEPRARIKLSLGASR